MQKEEVGLIANIEAVLDRISTLNEGGEYPSDFELVVVDTLSFIDRNASALGLNDVLGIVIMLETEMKNTPYKEVEGG